MKENINDNNNLISNLIGNSNESVTSYNNIDSQNNESKGIQNDNTNDLNIINNNNNLDNVIKISDNLDDNENIINKTLIARNNRKFKVKIIKTIQSLKAQDEDFSTIVNQVANLLSTSIIKITNIYDDNRNTLLHFSILDNNLYNFKIILESYISILGISKELIKFLLIKNNDGMNIFDLVSRMSEGAFNKETIKYLDEKFHNKYNQIFKYIFNKIKKKKYEKSTRRESNNESNNNNTNVLIIGNSNANLLISNYYNNNSNYTNNNNINNDDNFITTDNTDNDNTLTENEDIQKNLAKYYDSDCQYVTTTNLFHHAASTNQCYSIVFYYENLQKLFKRSLLIDLKNSKGIAPIHLACYYGNKGAMDLLLDLGANIDSIDNQGNTPLHYAIEGNSENIVKKLIVRGANKFIKNNKAMNAYEYAKYLKREQLSNILKHKNCIDRKIYGNELGPIKGGKNNFLLTFILLVIIMCKSAYILRIHRLIFPAFFVNSLIPFTPSLLDSLIIEKNETNKTDSFVTNNLGFNDPYYQLDHHNYRNDTVYNLSNFFNCFDDKCISECIITCTSTLNDIFLFGVLLSFLFFGVKVFIPRNKKSEKYNLANLYEKGEYVCVKCRLVVDVNTQHCLVCNACVKKWDHHCFWLNTCISEDNKKHFIFFLYSTLCFIIQNILFSIMNIYLYAVSNDLFFIAFFEINTELSYSSTLILIYKIVLIIANCYLFCIGIYSLFFVIIPVIKNNNYKKKVIFKSLSKYQVDLLGNRQEDLSINSIENKKEDEEVKNSPTKNDENKYIINNENTNNINNRKSINNNIKIKHNSYDDE